MIMVKAADSISSSLATEVAMGRLRMMQNLPVANTGGLILGDETRPLELRAPAKLIRGKSEDDTVKSVA